MVPLLYILAAKWVLYVAFAIFSFVVVYAIEASTSGQRAHRHGDTECGLFSFVFKSACCDPGWRWLQTHCWASGLRTLAEAALWTSVFVYLGIL